MTDEPKNQPLEQVLDQYLFDGFMLRRTWLEKYEKLHKQETFDVNEYQQLFGNAIDKWYKKVGNYLLEYLSEDRFLAFHFLHPKPNAFHNPHPLDNQMHSLDRYLYALEDVVVRLKDRSVLESKRKIAEIENRANIIYQIRFSWHSREIKVNDMLLAKPNTESRAMLFFEYVYDRANTPLKVEDIEKATKQEIGKSVHDLLRDLNFKGKYRTVFFPKATKTSVLFVNPISREYFIKHELPLLDINPNEK